MQVVHEQVGLDNKKSKPLKVVDDGKQEKLEPFRLEDEVKSPNETDQQPSDQEEEIVINYILIIKNWFQKFKQ